MRLTFLGTGTSMGIPIAGGFGTEYAQHDPRNNRYRCSAWVETGDLSILIDVGPEFRLQSLRAGLKRVDLLLITHEHFDHIGGLDDLRPYNYAQKGAIPMYTTANCAAAIEKRYDYMFGPDRYKGAVDAEINVADGPFEFRGQKIIPLPVDHGNVDVIGFRIGDLSYVTDAKIMPQSTKDLIKGSKVLVLNALRWEPKHPTHLTIPESIENAQEL